ncbi:hypothetical protein [Thioclava sp. F34-6]|uniref:hypothetical protein n=1 Tax=Thioclava sp. F34-6 TaxID=1973003 RepID=UPI0011BAC7CB|nr:hypothetical protein [Thioclava sp. F34-6]
MTDKRMDRETDAFDGAALEQLFSEARAAGGAEPGEGFLARVLADAEAEQAAFARQAPVDGSEAPDVLAGIWDALRGAFGGWAPMGGLVTAALAGVWIGFIGADEIGALSPFYASSTTESLGTVNLLPEGDTFAFVDEGGF